MFDIDVSYFPIAVELTSVEDPSLKKHARMFLCFQSGEKEVLMVYHCSGIWEC